MKSWIVTGNDRASATTGHGEAFEIEVTAPTEALARLRAMQARKKLRRHHILIGSIVEKVA